MVSRRWAAGRDCKSGAGDRTCSATIASPASPPPWSARSSFPPSRSRPRPTPQGRARPAGSATPSLRRRLMSDPRPVRISVKAGELMRITAPRARSESIRARPYVATKEYFPMGIFSRTRDIIAANVTDLLDKAEDPAKMIRMIILEMEETLVEVRASAARTIADQKEMSRQIGKLDRLQDSWLEKAELALSKDREDLAKAALLE